MINRYDILKYISQREDGEMPQENERLVSVTDVIRTAIRDCGADEAEYDSVNVTDLNEREKRLAERWAMDRDCWIPFENIFSLGVPGPSGSESDTYISKEGYVFKSNNLMHCHDSILIFLERTILYNMLFPDSAYTFIGFAGFEGRSIFPVVRQRHIKGGKPAKQNEIDCYMSAIGFDKIEEGKYKFDKLVVSDLFPKNVLKDVTGDMFVIDVEINLEDIA